MNLLSNLPIELLIIYSIFIILCGVGAVILLLHYCMRKRSSDSEQNELIASAMLSAAEALFIRKSKGKIVTCNQEFARLVGYTVEQVEGRDLTHFFPEPTVVYFDEVGERIRAAESKICFEVQLITKKGNALNCEVIMSSCSKFDTVLCVLRDVSEQNRVMNALLVRDRLLYALTFGTQKILESSQDFNKALNSALTEFGRGAQVDAVILAQTVSAESMGYNDGYDAEFYRITNFWSAIDGIVDNAEDAVFEITIDAKLLERSMEQDKVIFIPAEKLAFLQEQECKLALAEIVGFYAIEIKCQGLKWGLLLLACFDIMDKWDEETEDVIEITAFQFGVLLEKQKAEEAITKTVTALKRSQKRLNLALEVSGAASFEYDLFFDRFDIDKTLFDKLEYGGDPNNLTLIEMKSLIHPADYKDWHNQVSALLNGDTEFISLELRLRMSGGKYCWITMMASTVLDNDIICGINGVFQDNNDKMLSQTRLFEAEKVASVGELASTLVGSINSVNKGVLTDIECLQAEVDPGSTRTLESLEGIRQRLQASINISDNLLALNPGTEEHVGLVSINKLIQDIIGMVRVDFSNVGIQIEEELNPGIPSVVCSPLDLMHLIISLILTSKQSMVNAVEKVLTIATFMDYDSIMISVLDTGCGIGRDQSDEFFVTLNSGSNEDEFSTITGLGLNTLQLLIEKYGGYIEVNSVKGAGSEFVIILPRTPSEQIMENIIPFDEE